MLLIWANNRCAVHSSLNMPAERRMINVQTLVPNFWILILFEAQITGDQRPYYASPSTKPSFTSSVLTLEAVR